MMVPVARKRRRTADMTQTRALIHRIKSAMPRVSQIAFATMCNLAQSMQLPNCHPHDVRASRDEAISGETPYGRIIREETVKDHDGVEVKIPLADPFAMLYTASKCTYFGALLERTHSQTPSSPTTPWSILYYTDEVVPGNPMKSQNNKKVQVVYYTFAEFGADARSKEEFWLIASVLRSSEVNKIEGSMSQVAVQVLLSMFGTDTHNLKTAGIRVTTSNGQEIRIFAVLKGTPMDESAIHQTWLCKGASGIKICVLCANVVNKRWVGLKHQPKHSFFLPYHLVSCEVGGRRGVRGWEGVSPISVVVGSSSKAKQSKGTYL